MTERELLDLKDEIAKVKQKISEITGENQGILKRLQMYNCPLKKHT